MNVAFAVAAAVAVIAISGWVWSTRRAGRELAAARNQADQLDDQLQAATAALDEAAARAEQLEAAQTALRLEAAQRTTEEQSESGNSPSAAALWDLERLRLQREWSEVAGGDAPPPVPWDQGLRAAIAVELEIIREVIGTPSQLEPAHGPEAISHATASAATLLVTEVLRRLAAAGDHLVVSVSAPPDDGLRVAVITARADAEPDLSPLSAAATALGGELSWQTTSDQIETQLQLPAERSEGCQPGQA
jgi:uncharacterized iron-regulated membrane protein